MNKNEPDSGVLAHSGILPPEWSVTRPKKWYQSLYDLALAPVRMLLLPDHACETIHLTSLRAERFAAVLPAMKGRVLDIGAGDNVLVRLYRQQAANNSLMDDDAASSTGVDVIAWSEDVIKIDSSDKLPFADGTFDTVCYIACINHIPERQASLIEAKRVLKPGGQIVLTMIGRTIGEIGHMLWWYSEDKHREVDHEELMGMNQNEVITLLQSAGLTNIKTSTFLYNLNTLYIATIS